LSVNAYGSTVNELINQFSKLPGIGKKSAERIAYHFLRCSEEEAFAVANAIRQVKLKIRAGILG
jgi:recombination protein RecR